MLKKKKWFALIFVAMFAFGFSGCQKTDQEQPSQTTEENAEPKEEVSKEEAKEEEETEIVIEKKLLSKEDLKGVKPEGDFLIMTPQQFAENYNFIANLSDGMEEIKNFQIEKADGMKTYSYAFENGMKLNLIKEEEAEENQFSKIEFQKPIPSESFLDYTSDYMLQIYQGVLACAITVNDDVSKGLAYLIVTANDEGIQGKHKKANDKNTGLLFDLIYENEILTFSMSPIQKPIEIADNAFMITFEKFQEKYNVLAEGLGKEQIQASFVQERQVEGLNIIQIVFSDKLALLLEKNESKTGFSIISLGGEVDINDEEAITNFNDKAIIVKSICNSDSDIKLSEAFIEALSNEKHYSTISDDRINYTYYYYPEEKLMTLTIKPKQ